MTLITYDFKTESLGSPISAASILFGAIGGQTDSAPLPVSISVVDTYLAQTTKTLTNKTLTTPDINGGTADSLTSLSVRSTGGAFDLLFATAEAISANRTLSWVLGNTARSITLSGSPTLADWFDQSVKVAASPQFASLELGHASDTSLTRVSAGVAAIEGSNILLASGLGSITQAYDATLAALAAYNTNGLLTQTAADTFVGRALTGTANEITSTNGNGVSGNPTLSLPSALTFTGKTITGGTYSSPTAITGLPDPSSAQDAATKAYVDSVAAGLDVKPSVICATTANITLSGEQTLDGILTSASRVLVKNQSTASQNGIYVSAAGSWTRTTDMDAWAEVPGSFVFVETGTLYADTAWVSTANAGGTIGSTSITWSQFAGAGTYTATGGITLTGTQFAITTNGIDNTMIRQGVARSVVGVTGNATANVADIQGSASQFLGINSGGTAAAFQTMSGDATLSGGALTIANDAVTTVKILNANVTLAKIVNGTGLSVIGRSANSGGVNADITGTASQFLGVNSGGTAVAFQTMSGDATLASGVITIAAAAVTLAKMASIATASFIGRTTAGTGVPEALTATQATALLNNVVGDSGSGGTKGLVPAPAAGDAAASKFLKADGTWTAPAGAGTVTSVTPGGGLTSTLTATAPGSAITGSGTLYGAELVNAQTGTSYAILDADRAKLITAVNTAAQAYSIAQAGAASAFQAGWFCDLQNNSTAAAGIITITPTTSTINGASTLKVQPGQSVRIVSDGTNYQVFALGGSKQLPATATNDDANAGNIGELITTATTANSNANATVTMTIASPCVVTWTGHGLSTQAVTTAIKFTTTGALPTGLTAGTTYYLKAIDANTFNVATTVDNALAGTFINTSGSQSGTHTGDIRVSATTVTSGDLAGMSLTAGDWDVSGAILFAAGATTTVISLTASWGTTSATISRIVGRFLGLVLSGTGVVVGASDFNVLNFTTSRVSLSATTTIYFVQNANFGTSTMITAGWAKARRVR